MGPFRTRMVTIIAALHYLPSCPVGGKQQNLWPVPIFRCRPPDQRSVYGEGLNKVRRDRRLGIRSIPGRQTWGWRVHEKPASPATIKTKLATLSLRVTP